MGCLYCGVELSLIKRLASVENFCSGAHRECYQQEFSRIALSRLMPGHPQVQQKSAPRAMPAAANIEDETDSSDADVEVKIQRQLGVHFRLANQTAEKSASTDPNQAGFLLELARVQVPKPKPISREQPNFRFTQYAMPDSKIALIDEIASLIVAASSNPDAA